jgi:tetratricopeptide (TPR) repeat protein
VLVSSLVASLAAAQPASGSESARLFEEGRELAKSGSYADACDRFTRAYEIDRGVGIELNMADCHEHQGHFAEAWRLFDDVAKQSVDNPVRGKFARDRAAALEPHLATVVVKLADTDVTVTIAGKPVAAAAEIRQRVDPGDIEVAVIAQGRLPSVRSQRAVAGGAIVFDFAPRAVSSGAAAPTHRARRRVHLALGLEIGGAAVLGLSLGIILKAKSDYRDARDDYMASQSPADYARVEDARNLGRMDTYVFVAGAAAVLAGGIVYFTAPRETVLLPTASRDGGGVTLSRRF